MWFSCIISLCIDFTMAGWATVRHVREGRVLEVGHAQSGPQFFGDRYLPPTVWPRTTKFGVVTRTGRGVLSGHTRHCTLHKCVARFVSNSWASCSICCRVIHFSVEVCWGNNKTFCPSVAASFLLCGVRIFMIFLVIRFWISQLTNEVIVGEYRHTVQRKKLI